MELFIQLSARIMLNESEAGALTGQYGQARINLRGLIHAAAQDRLVDASRAGRNRVA